MTLLSLCELASVKQRLNIDDTSRDTILGELIVSVSRSIEQWCNRDFYLEERTQEYSTASSTGPITLRAYPVASISSVKNTTSWDWANATALESDAYRASSDSGVLYFKGAIARGPLSLQVVYTGGLATSAADVASTYPDLAAAAEMQVVEEFQRRDSQGAVTYTLSEGGGAGQQQALKLLPSVREKLAPYKRRTLG
jgi:hypothetical protein